MAACTRALTWSFTAPTNRSSTTSRWLVGADSGLARIAFDGTSPRRLSDGSLLLKTGASQVIQHPPAAYEIVGKERRVVPSAHVLAQRAVSFDVSLRNPAQRLVIDPVITFSQRIGGGGTELIHAMKVDSFSNIYIAGETDSTEVHFPADSATARRANKAAWFMKLDATGSQVRYRVFIDGARNDKINAPHVDGSGNVYAAGTTSSSSLEDLRVLVQGWKMRSWQSLIVPGHCNMACT